MVILQQTYLEFINSLNLDQDQINAMIKNTTINRKFFSVKIQGEWFHGLRERNQIKDA